MSKSNSFIINGTPETAFDVVVNSCRFSLIEKWNYSGVAYASWILYWNPDPGARIECNQQTIILDAAHIALIPPNTNFSTRNERPFRHLYIHFEAPPPFDRVRRDILRFPAHETKEFFLGMEIHRSGYAIPLLLRRMLYAYLLLIPEEQFLNPGEMTLDRRIRRAIELMNEHLNKPPCNRDICRKAGMSLPFYYHKFAQELGMSPRRYLLNQRMECARRLLVHTDDSIDEIAEKTGYADRFHFSKTFKKFYTISPAAYRQNDSGNKFSHSPIL